MNSPFQFKLDQDKEKKNKTEISYTKVKRIFFWSLHYNTEKRQNMSYYQLFCFL